jgi:uncharacterized membrane protein
MLLRCAHAWPASGRWGFVLVRAHTVHGVAQGMLAALGLLSVAVSWLTVHTIFTLRYALLYYSDPVGGVDFNSDERPCYRDSLIWRSRSG